MLKSVSDHSKISETRSKPEKSMKKYQRNSKVLSTISNAQKHCQNVKNTKKPKKYMSNDPKAAYFSKNHVLEHRKLLKIVDFR